MSRITFKTIHEIQIVFGRQFAFVSLKDLSPQKYIAKMTTRPWRMILTTFLHQSERLQILKLNLAEEHNFVLHENVFTSKCFPASEQFTFNYVDCKQVADVINAMPSNKDPSIDKVPTRVLKDSLLITLPFYYVNHQCFSFSFNIPRGLENCRNYTYSQTRQPRTS